MPKSPELAPISCDRCKQILAIALLTAQGYCRSCNRWSPGKGVGRSTGEDGPAGQMTLFPQAPSLVAGADSVAQEEKSERNDAAKTAVVA